MNNHKDEGTWDTQYEWRAVLLLSIGFGLVGLDRFMIQPMFPVMTKDLAIDYQDLGLTSGILAVAWGVAAMFSGRIADRIGHRKILIPATVVFSLLAGLSGLATGVGSPGVSGERLIHQQRKHLVVLGTLEEARLSAR